MTLRNTLPVTRRGFLGGSAALLAGAALTGRVPLAAESGPQATPPAPPAPSPPAAGPFQLPELPYAHDALEPVIDTLTMQIHHGKHHAAYVANLNTALAPHAELAKLPIEELLKDGASRVPEAIRQGVINNGGGHANHSLFWRSLAPRGKGGAPSEGLGRAIESSFVVLDALKTAMNEAGAKRFGSGWAWLVRGAEGRLEVISTANQDSPLLTGKTPLLGIDVWEHAYYLHYQNRRADYLKAIWEVVDWAEVSRRFGG
jgi:Fe-Mn family superoxide dismutase